MKRQVGLFGGSFDPIHFGHINLSIEILEKANLDEILFCPANISPYKIDSQHKAKANHRLNMVNLAIDGIDKFSSYDEEIKRNDVSYTIDTLRALKKKLKDSAEINLIIDQDLLEKFCGWKECNKIFDYAKVIIGCRSSFSKKNIPSCLSSELNKEIIITNQFEISSTQIRERLARRSYCGHLVPAKVLDYIYKHGLY